MIDKVVNNSKSFELAFAGDLVLDVPEPDHWLAGLKPSLDAVDLAIGHLEVPHTRRGSELSGDVPAPGADPDAIVSLARCGFDAVTLAGNQPALASVRRMASQARSVARVMNFISKARSLTQYRKPYSLSNASMIAPSGTGASSFGNSTGRNPTASSRGRSSRSKLSQG
jgi:hypothetical protein